MRVHDVAERAAALAETADARLAARPLLHGERRGAASVVAARLPARHAKRHVFNAGLLELFQVTQSLVVRTVRPHGRFRLSRKVDLVLLRMPRLDRVRLAEGDRVRELLQFGAVLDALLERAHGGVVRELVAAVDLSHLVIVRLQRQLVEDHRHVLIGRKADFSDVPGGVHRIGALRRVELKVVFKAHALHHGDERVVRRLHRIVRHVEPAAVSQPGESVLVELEHQPALAERVARVPFLRRRERTAHFHGLHARDEIGELHRERHAPIGARHGRKLEFLQHGFFLAAQNGLCRYGPHRERRHRRQRPLRGVHLPRPHATAQHGRRAQFHQRKPPNHHRLPTEHT